MCFVEIGMALGASKATAAAAGMTAVSTAIAGTSAVLQAQQASNQAKSQTAQFNQNKLLAQRSMLQQARQLSLREDQERAAAMDKKFQSNIEAAKIKGRQIASAGEAGVAGLSIANLLSDVERTRLNNEGTINRNFDAVLQQGKVDREGLLSQAEGRIASVQQGTPPSLLASGLQIGGVALKGYRQFRKDKTPIYKSSKGA
tara:strand:+ start:4918 stop:5520 length:603 start_codon:yes stop_codon:yes gene_type:complete